MGWAPRARSVPLWKRHRTLSAMSSQQEGRPSQTRARASRTPTLRAPGRTSRLQTREKSRLLLQCLVRGTFVTQQPLLTDTTSQRQPLPAISPARTPGKPHLGRFPLPGAGAPAWANAPEVGAGGGRTKDGSRRLGVEPSPSSLPTVGIQPPTPAGGSRVGGSPPTQESAACPPHLRAAFQRVRSPV